GAIAIRIDFDRFAHVDIEQLEKHANEQILEPGRPHPGCGVDHSRQPVLRQGELQQDEQPAAPAAARLRSASRFGGLRSAHAGPVTMRWKSACSASTVNGPVRTAASFPLGSSTQIALEWSTA